MKGVLVAGSGFEPATFGSAKSRCRTSFRFGVRDAELLASDSGHSCDGRVIECLAKGVSADHSSRTHDYERAGSAVGTLMDEPVALLVAVMTMRAPPVSRRRAGAPQTATSRPS
jgi:hypothetical protein